MVWLAFYSSTYAQIFCGRLALIVENLKAYFLALPKLGKAGLPGRREMNKKSAPLASVRMNSKPFDELNDLTVPVAIILVSEFDHNSDFAVQKVLASREPRLRCY